MFLINFGMLTLCTTFLYMSKKPMTTKIGQQVYLEEKSRLRLVKQLPVTSLRKDHVTLKKPL